MVLYFNLLLRIFRRFSVNCYYGEKDQWANIDYKGKEADVVVDKNQL